MELLSGIVDRCAGWFTGWTWDEYVLVAFLAGLVAYHAVRGVRELPTTLKRVALALNGRCVKHSGRKPSIAGTHLGARVCIDFPVVGQNDRGLVWVRIQREVPRALRARVRAADASGDAASLGVFGGSSKAHRRRTRAAFDELFHYGDGTVGDLVIENGVAEYRVRRHWDARSITAPWLLRLVRSTATLCQAVELARPARAARELTPAAA